MLAPTSLENEGGGGGGKWSQVDVSNNFCLRPSDKQKILRSDFSVLVVKLWNRFLSLAKKTNHKCEQQTQTVNIRAASNVCVCIGV